MTKFRKGGESTHGGLMAPGVCARIVLAAGRGVVVADVLAPLDGTGRAVVKPLGWPSPVTLERAEVTSATAACLPLEHLREVRRLQRARFERDGGRL